MAKIYLKRVEVKNPYRENTCEGCYFKCRDCDEYLCREIKDGIKIFYRYIQVPAPEETEAVEKKFNESV